MRAFFILLSISMFALMNIQAQNPKAEEKKESVIIKEEIDENGNKIVTRTVEVEFEEENDMADVDWDKEHLKLDIEIDLSGIEDLEEEIERILEEVEREIESHQEEFEEMEIHNEKMHRKIIKEVRVETGGDKPKLGVYIEENEGMVMINGIIDDSPAAKSDLEEGDIIQYIDQQRIYSMTGLIEHLSSYDKGETIKVKVLRDGDEKNVKVKL